MRWHQLLVLFFGFAGACAAPLAPDPAVAVAGPFAVAATSWRSTGGGRRRDLPVTAWYPTAALPAVAQPFYQLESEPQRSVWQALLAASPTCPQRTHTAAQDAAPIAAAPLPIVLVSHCYNCNRFNLVTVAERLASHGIVVVAVEHPGDTLWDHLAGRDVAINKALLEQRAGDIRQALDGLLDGGEAPSSLEAAVDRHKIGIVGHSLGAVTAGRVAELDDRIISAAALMAPIENPFVEGVTLANINKPLLFVVAQEDNSISELGNELIRKNYAAAPGPTWKLELADAGHWSISDLNGTVDQPLPGAISPFAAGCGTGIRQTDDAPFTYLEPTRGRAIAASYLTAFFLGTLQRNSGAIAYLQSQTDWVEVTAVHR
ncbi:MAG: dienelactone hydrolase family protein [Kofleriaceae bacterium]|nr:dienelactone hydrolase family protein [Kofleriaceae bacterium]